MLFVYIYIDLINQLINLFFGRKGGGCQKFEIVFLQFLHFLWSPNRKIMLLTVDLSFACTSVISINQK